MMRDLTTKELATLVKKEVKDMNDVCDEHVFFDWLYVERRCEKVLSYINEARMLEEKNKASNMEINNVD